MNPVSIFDGQRISQIQTCQRWMLKNKIEQLLLEFSSINAIVFDGDSNQALVVNDSVEQFSKAKIQIVERQVKADETISFTNDFR